MLKKIGREYIEKQIIDEADHHKNGDGLWVKLVLKMAGLHIFLPFHSFFRCRVVPNSKNEYNFIYFR